MSTHSQTPWDVDRYAHDEAGNAIFYIESPDGCVGEALTKEDAAHIVKCVNLHDELVAALRAVAEHFDGTDAPLLSQVRAALAAMEAA